MAVYLAVSGDLFDGVFFLILCCPFSHEMSWMRSWTELSQFLIIFLPSLVRNQAFGALILSQQTTESDSAIYLRLAGNRQYLFTFCMYVIKITRLQYVLF